MQERAAEARRQEVRGPLELRIESRNSGSRDLYRVQVASFGRRETAEELSRKLQTDLAGPVGVRQSPEGYFQVRAGEFESRQDALNFAAGPVRRAGFSDAFVVKDPGTVPARGVYVALRGPEKLFRISSSGFLFYPATPADSLRLGGKPYRGLLEVSLNSNGRITVVNQLGLEEYLFGVVPAEMSPSTYPQPAALAAQAIAARTYALKNMGRFSGDGFDLTDDTRTQVYGGVAAERGPTNEAVRLTYGLAVYYQGQLIEAMYSSTCGGRTEDYAAVFDAPPVPYLKGVICAVESAQARGEDNGLRGSHLVGELILAGDGRIANRELELAALFGLIPASSELISELEEPAAPEEVGQWVAASAAALRRPVRAVAAGSAEPVNYAGFIAYAAAALIGQEQIQRAISPMDADYYLANMTDGSEVSDDARAAVAFVRQKGIWPGFPDNSIRPAAPILRKDALSLLVRMMLFAHPEMLHSAVLVSVERPPAGGSSQPALTIKWGNRDRQLTLADNARLFQRSDERSTPSGSLVLIGNEKLTFHLDAAGRLDFLEAGLNPTGAASDRFSPAAEWHVSFTRSQLGEKLKPLAPEIGEFLDLEPEKIGESGRVLRFSISGSRQVARVNGYRVKSALGLRDTLVTIRRSQGPDGKIHDFFFDGRGYGHGVGLCQVGAYGMAKAGRSFEEILKAYYTGVEIAKAY